MISELRRTIADELEQAGVDDARFDADELICFALGINRTDLILHGDSAVDDGALSRIRALVDRRKSGEPLQYIVGKWEFYSLPFYVGDGVLIPRADTEVLVDRALAFLKDRRSPAVLDLCSGSGCIAVSIKKNVSDADVTAVELYDPAFGYLERNAALNHADINIVRADVLIQPLGLKKYDLITANPPYIASTVIPTLSREVGFEPETALDGGDDGLKFYRAIAKMWIPLLKTDGKIMAEIGEEQAQDVSRLFCEQGLTCETVRDLNVLDRVIVGTQNNI